MGHRFQVIQLPRSLFALSKKPKPYPKNQNTVFDFPQEAWIHFLALRNQSSGATCTAATTTRASHRGTNLAEILLRRHPQWNQSSGAHLLLRQQQQQGLRKAEPIQRSDYHGSQLPVDPLTVDLLDWFRNATNPSNLHTLPVDPLAVD